MDNMIYINLDTHEKTEDVPGYIRCDKEIADVIMELNKKGYKTTASCAGHNKSGSINKYTLPLKDYEEWIKTFGNHKLLVRTEEYDDKSFVCISKETTANIYIAFAHNYDFDEIPDGFEVSNFNDGTNLSCRIYYYEDEKEETWEKMKTQKQIDDEIENARANLLTWAKKIKPVYEKGIDK